MWFSRRSVEMCISAAVFYSSFFASECRGDDDVPGKVWSNDDEFIHIYRTEIPWKPVTVDRQTNTFAVTAWIAVLSIAVCVAVIVCIFCICWTYYPKRRARRRRSTNAALVPPATRTEVIFHTDHDVDLGIRNSTTRTGSVYHSGVVNFAFTRSAQDPVPTLHLEDGPPAYSTVFAEPPPDDKPTNARYPRVDETKTVETPPPAYVTIAPFQ